MSIDFSSTQSIRSTMINRNLRNPTEGPHLFTSNNYQVSNLTDSPVIDLPNVEAARTSGLDKPRTLNTFKPQNFSIFENLSSLQRRANLQLYPYFNTDIRHTFVGYYTNTNYDNESELIKFAARNMKDSDTSPILNRIKQNLNTATNGRFKLGEALNGNLQTAIDIVTGKAPLVVPNYKITVAKTLAGKGIDFVQTVLGVTTPFTEIPGDYLTNPRNPVNPRPEAQTGIGNLIQDVTGAVGSLFGIQRRPKRDRKPSDLFIEYMGEGQKQTLFNLLSFSKYAPNYTTSARSQQSSKLFQFADNFASGVKNVLGLEAPRGMAYIGDDRGEDVQFAMHDLNGRPVRSNYYLTLMFDPIAAQLFHNDRSSVNGGPIGGTLTWVGKNSQNKLGVNNQEYGGESSELENSLSTKYGFRENSILAETQRILNSKPKDGSGRSHIGHIIDQTSRSFSEGDVMISKGSAIKYVDKFTKQENGVEYARVWTKDRPYFNMSDTMKKTGIIRKYDESVMGGLGRAWNLNIAPMSNGRKDNRSFDGSSNIVGGYKYGMDADGKGFYAKKYMFSIENLAWKTSKKDGFTVLDLPFCERGPNGGRVMWFPPYDLKVSEQNSARWETNSFLGRPEPIYTYQNTERSGQISFKVVVDHPSVLNLLVREEFKNMSDEEADNYINAFFAGAKDIEFYDLIRRYTTLSTSDLELITKYLEKGQNPEVITNLKYNSVAPDLLSVNSDSINPNANKIKIDSTLLYRGSGNGGIEYPDSSGDPGTKTSVEYSKEYGFLNINIEEAKTELNSNITAILNKPLSNRTSDEKNDLKLLFGTDDPQGTPNDNANKIVTELTNTINNNTTQYTNYKSGLSDLKSKIKEKRVNNIKIFVFSSSSAPKGYNPLTQKLASIRRSYSIVKDILIQLTNDGKTPVDVKAWNGDPNGDEFVVNTEYSFINDLGYDFEGKLVFDTVSKGVKHTLADGRVCSKESFYNSALKRFAPATYGCRQSSIKLEVEILPPPRDPVKGPTEIPKTKLVIDGNEPITVGKKLRRPNIDVMKRIIMKTLSESYYFKMLEEDSPVAFKSLREKLKYFHPAFHSTTPEGLNSRLTFLQQCIRPGDTIPIKGIADDSDLNARNTSFGPPPICVLRIGDFYHSKIIIRDVNITFEENVWDLNPEGIGVQPMIANVSLQINFLGGQGLREPVSKLQNALSSNFYANTEMYDERSFATSEKIGDMDREAFTREFLESIRNNKLDDTSPNDDQNTNITTKGKYIGIIATGGTSETLNYSSLIDEVVNNCNDYFKSYMEFYNKFVPLFGQKIVSVFLSSKYRKINKLNIDEDNTTNQDVEILGEYPAGKEREILLRGFRAAMETCINSLDFIDIFKLRREVPNSLEDTTNVALRKKITELVVTGTQNKKSIIDEIVDNTEINKLETNRNNLIQIFDKLNYLVKYQQDGQIDGQIYKDAVLPVTFTSNILYKNYQLVVDYIKSKHSKLSEDIDDSINFNGTVISNDDCKDVLKTVLQNSSYEIAEVFDRTIFGDNTVNKIISKIKDFMSAPKEKTFKLGKEPKLLKTLDQLKIELTFNIQSKNEITLQEKKDKILKINSSVNKLGTKLNFYRNGS